DFKRSHQHCLGGAAQRYALIDSMRPNFPIKDLCEALEVCVSGYHASRRRAPSARQLANAQLLQQMRAIQSHRHTRSYGSPRRVCELRDRGLGCSEKTVLFLLRLLRRQFRKTRRRLLEVRSKVRFDPAHGPGNPADEDLLEDGMGPHVLAVTQAR